MAMNKEFLAAGQSICDRKDLDSRDKLSALERLRSGRCFLVQVEYVGVTSLIVPCDRFSGPALFMSRLLPSCCLQWSVLENPFELYQENMRHNVLDQEERNNDLLAFLLGAWHKETDTFDRFRVEGVDMCEQCFITLFGIGASTWYNRKVEFRNGVRHWEHGSLGGHAARLTEVGANTRDWMREYFDTLGDHQPDTGQVHLPPGDKKDIFDN